MSIRLGILAAVIIVAIGCSETSKKSGVDTPPPKPRAELLLPRLWDDKPREFAEVAAVRDLADGTEVNLVGWVPQGNCKPFNAAVATVILMDPTDLSKDEVKTELNCADAATCPRCRKLLDNLAIQVELVDDKGQVLPTTLETFSGLKPGSRVAFAGTVRKGKQARPVRFVATSFAVLPDSGS
jgi:hypothetical protein